MVTLDFNYYEKTRILEKYWAFCICTCHAYTMLREDVRSQLLEAHKECGFKFVRFHDLFNDDMSVVNKSMDGKLIFSYFNIDNIYDFLLRNGMKPLVEIGFMPKVLASGNKKIFHYEGNTTLPKNYSEWSYFISDFIKHLIKRYGKEEVESWYFEFWNEPNIAEDLGSFGSAFFAGSKEEYFNFYKTTYKVIKEIDCDIKIGGPVTSNNKRIKDFLTFSYENNIKPDFISTHQYPADCVVCSEEGRKVLNKIKETFAVNKSQALKDFLSFREGVRANVPRGELTLMAKKVREEAGNLSLFYTEWSSLAGQASDSPFGSSFIVKTAMDNIDIVDGYGYWCLSDIFEESGQVSEEFHGGYGLITYHFIKKAPYNAFKLLNLLPNEMYLKNSFHDETLDVYSFKDEKSIYILLNNHNSLLHEIGDKEVEINFKDIKITRGEKWVIDENHSNAFKLYIEKYSKEKYLKEEEINEIKKEAELYHEKFDLENNGSIKTSVLKMGTVLLRLDYEERK